jgi:hypothetical protein
MLVFILTCAIYPSGILAIYFFIISALYFLMWIYFFGMILYEMAKHGQLFVLILGILLCFGVHYIALA